MPRINISYRESLTFEQFKEQFEEHFLLSSPKNKEAEMKKAWERAETLIPKKEEGGEEAVTPKKKRW